MNNAHLASLYQCLIYIFERRNQLDFGAQAFARQFHSIRTNPRAVIDRVTKCCLLVQCKRIVD